MERRKVVTVTILDAEEARGAAPEDHAARVRAAILAELPGGGVDYADWDNRRMRAAWYGADAAAVD